MDISTKSIEINANTYKPSSARLYQTARSIRKNIMGHNSPLIAYQAKNERLFQKLQAKLADFDRHIANSAVSTQVDTCSSIGSGREVSHFSLSPQDIGLPSRLESILEVPGETSEMKQPRSFNQYLLRQNDPVLPSNKSSFHKERSNNNKPIDVNDLGLGTELNNKNYVTTSPSPSPSPFTLERDCVRHSLYSIQSRDLQHRYSNTSRQIEIQERYTFNIGLENNVQPIAHSLRNCQSGRLSMSYQSRSQPKSKPKMVNMRREKLCRSYRTIKLALLVPEDVSYIDQVGRLVSQATEDGVIVVSLDD